MLSTVLSLSLGCWSFGYGDKPQCEAGGALQVAKTVTPTAEQLKTWGRSVRLYSIDIDSDGKPDLIVERPLPKGQLSTCFVDSAGTERHCLKGPARVERFSIRWFAQLDEDPLLELFAMDGDEDTSSYRIQKLDPKTWKPQDLVAITPLVRVEKRAAWGYPWHITDLPLETKNGVVTLLAAPGTCAEPEEGAPPKTFVFFTGKAQSKPDGSYDKALAAASQVKVSALAGLVKAPCGK